MKTPALAGALEAPAVKLSERQEQVLQLLAEGMTTEEIAHELHLSGKTVSFHLTAIHAKTGLRSVALLTQYALARHIAEPTFALRSQS